MAADETGRGAGGWTRYFRSVEQALHMAGVTQPTLVVDRRRFDRNLEKVLTFLPNGMGLRIVAKSLPSMPLLRRCLDAAGANRLMTFNLPMLIQIAEEMPDADQLLGKPFPIAAAAAFFRQQIAPENLDRVHWLVDTPERLGQYENLASDIDRVLDIVLEIDVGLHRGGFVPGPALVAALEVLRESGHLRFGGFMGYEAHVAKIPSFAGWRDRVHRRALAIYAAANRAAADVLGAATVEASLRNTAGSQTFTRYRDTRIANDLSLGSALVKPTDFDHESLADLEPAMFIAAPVLKTVDAVLVPGLEWLLRARNLVTGGGRKAVYIHGGNWKAVPVDPPGTAYHNTFGRSSNQEMLTIPRSAAVNADDFLFFRPTQSEAVMQHFGDIAVFDDDRIVDWWPALPTSP